MNEQTNLETRLKGVLESRAATVHVNFDSAGEVVGRSRRIRRLVLASVASAMVIVVVGGVQALRVAMEPPPTLGPAGEDGVNSTDQAPAEAATGPEPTESPTPWTGSEPGVVADGRMAGVPWRLELTRRERGVCSPHFALWGQGASGYRCRAADAWGDLSLHQVRYPDYPEVSPVWGLISKRVASVTVNVDVPDGPTKVHADIMPGPDSVEFDLYLAFLPHHQVDGTVVARDENGEVIETLKLCKPSLRYDVMRHCDVP